MQTNLEDQREDFPLFPREEEQVIEKIVESDEEPMNKKLRVLFGRLGIILIVIGSILTITLLNFIFGPTCIAIGVFFVWASKKLDECPVVVPIYSLILTNDRLINTTRVGAESADTGSGPQLDTYSSKLLSYFYGVTIVLPIVLLMFSYAFGISFLNLFSIIGIGPVEATPISLGLFIVPFLVFVFTIVGKRGWKKGLILAGVTAFVYYLYFSSSSTLDPILLLDVFPQAFVVAAIQTIFVFFSLLTFGIPFGFFQLPLSLIFGIGVYIFVNAKKRGSGKSSPTRNSSLWSQILARPSGISRFWNRISTEMIHGGQYHEQDIPISAINRVETRTHPTRIMTGEIPIEIYASLIASFSISFAWSYYILLSSGVSGYGIGDPFSVIGSIVSLVLFILLPLVVCKRSCSEGAEKAVEQSRIAAILMVIAIILLSSGIFGLGYVMFGILISSTTPLVELYLIYRMHNIAKNEIEFHYFHALKFSTQHDVCINPPKIVHHHANAVDRILSFLNIDGLRYATVDSARFKKVDSPSLGNDKVVQLGTQLHDSTCVEYMYAHAKPQADLVSATAVSFPFMAIAFLSLSIFEVILIVLLGLSLILVVGYSGLFSAYLLSFEEKIQNFFSLVVNKDSNAEHNLKYEGYFASIHSVTSIVILLVGLGSIFISFSSLGIWMFVLFGAELIGWYVIKGMVFQLFMFGTWSGEFDGFLWLEKFGLTWTTRSRVYAYTVSDSDETVTQYGPLGYDSRGRYYSLTYAHSIANTATSYSPGMSRFVAVGFILGIVYLVFNSLSAMIPALQLWLLFILVFITAFGSSYAVYNLIKAVVPAWGLFLDGRGSFDQFLSIDNPYPGIITTLKSINETGNVSRSIV
ncbi:MAG: hypothetical protein GF411_14580 [Candidatus Lokiarchaeota archaeon]|nr:hypothetical protein [Candidatus Lokiarchaeota archaeon]